MERRSPGEFPVDDRRVYDAYIAGRQSAALAVAVRVGLFDALHRDGPLDEVAIARSFDWGERPTRSLLTALCAMGLLRREDDRFALADDTRRYAVRGQPGSLWALIDMEIENYLSPGALLAALAKDGASVYGELDPWEAHANDPHKARSFTAAMHSVSERPAAGLAEVVDLPTEARVLDVGGGSGALSIAIARRHPRVRCTVFELAAVCGVADEFIAAAGVGDRVSTEAGDMFRDTWPDGHDTVLLSQILHDWSFDDGAALLAKAFASLPHGGQVLIHEKLIDDDRDAPLANALVHLDMLVWTEGQQYRFTELRDALLTAGFREVERRPTAGYWTLVSALRP